MQIKMTLKLHLTPTGIMAVSSKQKITNVGEGMEMGDPIQCWEKYKLLQCLLILLQMFLKNPKLELS